MPKTIPICGVHSTFKIASKKTAFDNSETLEDQPLQETHDYDLADMDFDLTKSDEKARYVNHAQKICKKILQKEQFAECNIEKILEDRTDYHDKHGVTVDGLSKNDIIDELKKQHPTRGKRWDTFTAQQQSYIYHHYGVSAEYRLLKSKAKTYGGFDDLITFSSGNLRVFQELCGMSYIFTVRNDKKNPRSGDLISIKNQNKAITKLSDYYLSSISEIPKLGDMIQKLVNDLGDVFREKLLKHPTEPESARLTIRNSGELNMEFDVPSSKKYTIKEILDTCVMFSIFHEYGGKLGRRGKSGYATATYDYVLNRIYAGVLKISPRPMLSLSISPMEIKRLLDSKTQTAEKKRLIDKIRQASKTTPDMGTIPDFF